MNASSNGRAPSVTKGIRDLANDVICLVELQGQLFMTDVREGRARMLRSLALLGAAPVLALAALPVLILGLSTWLATQYGWDAAVVQIALAGTVLLVAALIGWRGWVSLEQSFTTLTRSRVELSENIRWLKSALSQRDETEDPFAKR